MAGAPPRFQRYALYYIPQSTALARFGAGWLGWDSVAGAQVAHPQVSGLPLSVREITQTPRRYGLHATIVPPFHLRDGSDPEALLQTLLAQCAGWSAVTLEGLELARLGRFLALVPTGKATGLTDLAAQALMICDPFRAALTPADLDRHRAKGLSPEQDRLLQRWGYPYVQSQFRFHITLTGKLPKATAKTVHDVLDPLLAPMLQAPVTIDHLALVGEDTAGWFHLIRQVPLARTTP